MVTQSTEAAGRSGDREIGAAVRAIGGLLLALAIMAGVGARHLVQQRDAGTVAVPPAAFEPSPRAATAAAARVLTVHLVGSQQHAASLQAHLADADSIRLALGE